jgi:TolB protein
MKKTAFIFGIIAIGLTSGWAEKVSLESYAHNLDSLAIAVLPFTSTGDKAVKAEMPWKTIADDLEFSGRFMVTRTEAIDTALFSKNNIPIYIDGKYSLEGSLIVMDCYLHDAKSGDVLAEKRYNGDVKFLRKMAHRFSNETVEMLFNDRGIFESKICFVRDEGNVKNLMVMDYDGHNLRQFTNNKSINVFPCFADSASILWTCYLRGQPDIFKGDLTTGKSRPLVVSRFIESSPAVSVVDGKIAFGSNRDGNMEIYTCDADGTGVKRLTFNKSIETSPCWSPNGFQIAFTSDRGGSPQIYIMDTDGANVRRLTYDGNYQDSPAWSPKGDKIAYMSQVSGVFQIVVIQPDGANAVQVTTNPGNNEYPAWSADGAHIVFSCKTGIKSDLYAIKADGTHLKKLTNTGNVPDWSN